MKYLESIQEAIYLSAGNASQYRRIMRIFFIEYEKMHFQLYKEDVLELLREYPEFSDYSMDQLNRFRGVGWMEKSYLYPRPEKSLYDCGI